MFNIPLDTKYVILEMLFPVNLSASTEITKSNPGETTTVNNNWIQYYKNKPFNRILVRILGASGSIGIGLLTCVWGGGGIDLFIDTGVREPSENNRCGMRGGETWKPREKCLWGGGYEGVILKHWWFMDVSFLLPESVTLFVSLYLFCRRI